ncbi:hypothetical protein [Actinomadura macrotermitis]|uniref:Uncharacterized protein n=1 Tax=Actinomadura macrotermitis TaxID=2585200 RepID=A0A7K0BTD2_9ACTN|nr:hypothetical protein [Actinomadura macrotermitis]MQY04450.1 hypothetical protein [Actinomadura macrotermitis]
MNPQWPGGQPGYPAQGGPPPMPAPGFPPPAPRPPSGGGGGIVVLLIAGVLVVLVVLVGAFVVLADDDKPDGRTLTLPSSTYTPGPGYSPEPTPTTRGTTSDPTTLLSPTIRTARGNTFTRVGTRTGSCTSRANSKMAPIVRVNPCVGDMNSAVYANPARTIITVVSIMKVGSSSQAAAVSRGVYQSAWPILLTPSDNSGLTQLKKEPGFWTRTWTRGSSLVFAQSYYTEGGASGGRSGPVFTTAGELGVEVANTMLFTS